MKILPSYFDEVFIRAVSFSFALEFETTRNAAQLFTEDVGCTSELDTTVEEQDEMDEPVEFELPSRSTQFTVVDEQPLEFEEPIMEEFEPSMDIVMNELPKPKRTSTRLLIASLSKLPEMMVTQPNITNERSEEEVRNPKKTPKKAESEQKKRRSSRLQELRKQQKEIEKAVTSTMTSFGSNTAVDKNQKKVPMKVRLVQSWRNMYRLTCTWLRKLHEKGEIRQSAFHSFLLNGVNALKKTLSAAAPRPPEVHDITLRFIVDFSKLYEIAQIRGMKEVIGTISRLVENVLGHYLTSSTKMNPTNLPWIQTKQLMKLLMSATMRPDSAYGLLQLLSRIQTYFISKCATRPNRNEEFIAYAIAQIQFFSSILAGRLEFLAEQKKYCMQF